MVLADWYPALTTTGLFAGLLWLLRNLILTRLSRSVAHEFDGKLESLRSDLRRSEEQLKAELSSKESEIVALRTGALTAITSRQIALDKRSIEAVDQLWTSVMSFRPAQSYAMWGHFLRFDAAADRAEHDAKFRDFLRSFSGEFDLQRIDASGANLARPFVSPMVWALYQALAATVMHGVMRWDLIKSGVGSKSAKNMINDEALAKLLKAVLPEQAELLDTYGASGFYLVIGSLERKLLDELRIMLTDTGMHRANVEHAAQIITLANEVTAQVNRTPGKAAGG